MSNLLEQGAEPHSLNRTPRPYLGLYCPVCKKRKGEPRSKLCVKCFGDSIAIPRIIYPDVYLDEENRPYRKIDLTHSRFAMVDQEDYEYLVQWRWRARRNGKDDLWYAVREACNTNGGHTLFMHKVLVNPPEGKETDHKNHNGLDNRRFNLRVCTRVQNHMNKRCFAKSRSGYRGVSWNSRKSKWKVGIFVDGKRLHLGYYIDLLKAAYVFDDAARKYHGEFACLNFPD